MWRWELAHGTQSLQVCLSAEHQRFESSVAGMSGTGAGESSQATIKESNNMSEMGVFIAAPSLGLFSRNIFVR